MDTDQDRPITVVLQGRPTLRPIHSCRGVAKPRLQAQAQGPPSVWSLTAKAANRHAKHEEGRMTLPDSRVPLTTGAFSIEASGQRYTYRILPIPSRQLNYDFVILGPT